MTQEQQKEPEEVKKAPPSVPTLPCTLSYPDKFYKAVSYVSDPVVTISHEARLLLYGLHKQATQGPCKEGKPWGWNVVENAKYQSWKALGSMSEVEAMRLFVRTLEEEEINWWAQLLEREAGNPDLASPGARGSLPPGYAVPQGFPDPASDPPITGVFEAVVPGTPARPTPRYDHAAVMVGHRMVLHGGNYSGRYLGDTWLFDTAAAEWVQVAAAAPETAEGPEDPRPSPRAGHSLVGVDANRVLCLGGFARASPNAPAKANKKAPAPPPAPMDAFLLDLAAGAWTRVETKGTAPTIRRSHSCSIVGRKVFVFGGEDPQRRVLGDLHVLDTETWEWSEPACAGPAPAPRSAHTATVWQNKWIVVFGGGSVATCHDDLFALDTTTMTWRKLELVSPETFPSARAGHSAGALGRYWYIVGGGNNAAACTDVVALDLSRVPTGKAEWFKLGLLPDRSPITSEGMSLVAVPQHSGLMTFGGYNGKYQNQLHLYVSAQAAEAVNGAANGTAKAGASGAAPATNGGPGARANARESEAAAAAPAAAAAEIAGLREEAAALKKQLAEREKEVGVARQALQAAEGRVMKLEVDLAERDKTIGALQVAVKELEAQKAQATAGGGGGIWGYISGQK